MCVRCRPLSSRTESSLLRRRPGLARLFVCATLTFSVFNLIHCRVVALLLCLILCTVCCRIDLLRFVSSSSLSSLPAIDRRTSLVSLVYRPLSGLHTSTTLSIAKNHYTLSNGRDRKRMSQIHSTLWKSLQRHALFLSRVTSSTTQGVALFVQLRDSNAKDYRR